MTGTQKPGRVRSVNSQITDAISQTNTLALGLAPAQSIGTLYQTTAQAIGASVQNAVANQQNHQSLNLAALAQNLQAILRNTAVAVHSPSGPFTQPPPLPRSPSHQRAHHHMTMQEGTGAGPLSRDRAKG